MWNRHASRSSENKMQPRKTKEAPLLAADKLWIESRRQQRRESNGEPSGRLSKPLALVLISAECNFQPSRDLHYPIPPPTPSQYRATILNSVIPTECLIQCDRPLIESTCVGHVFITSKIAVPVTLPLPPLVLQGVCG